MTRINASLFEEMPIDAYKTIAQATLGTDDDRIAALNMLEYYDAIESFFDSRVDAEALLLPFFAERYADQYPRLSRLARGHGMKAGERAAKRDIIGSILARTTHYDEFINNINIYNSMAYEYASQSRDISVQLTLPDYKPMTTELIYQFNASDTPGFAKAKIKLARESALAILKMGVPMLVEWGNRNAKKFELRSPLAFTGPKLRDLLTHNYEIGNPKQYLTQNFITSWDVAYGIDPALGYSLNRTDFKKWVGSNALAAMWGWGSSTDYVLTARDMPSILFAEHDRLLPVYLNRYDTPFINDVVNRVHHVSADEITSLAANPDQSFEYPEQKTTDRIMCDCMALVAFAFTVVINNIEMGRGHHKPRWVHSDLNPINIHHMQHLAPVILHRMRESLENG